MSSPEGKSRDRYLKGRTKGSLWLTRKMGR